jgi:LmeA-like phospholipid-binding
MRKVLIALVVLVILLFAVDRIAKVVVQHQAAGRIQDEYDLSERPNVNVHGFPFLTQVLRRELTRVDVDAAGVAIEDVQNLDVDLTLRDVRLLDGYRGRASELNGTVLVPYDELARLIRDTGAVGINLGYGGARDTIAIRTSIAGPAGDVDVVAFGALRLSGSRLTMRPTRFEVNGEPADPIVAQLARNQLQLDVRIPRIPGTISFESLSATEAGLQIGVAGRNLSVG